MKNWAATSTALAMVLAVEAMGTAGHAQSAPPTKDVAVPDEIIVTATRRDEKINTIPVAIQALGGKTLAQLNITNFDQLVEYLPNVRTASRGPGVEGIYIRGLSTDTPGLQITGTGAAFPNVALYLNDAPSAMPGRNLDIYPVDLERVEVLAGPQGTLFGASAMGGAVRYITNKPNLKEFHIGVDVSYSTTRHGDYSASGSGYINVPIIKDKLAVRFALFDDSKGGYINNIPGTYQMPFNPGSPGVLPSGNPALVNGALYACSQNAALCTAGTYPVPIRDSISNAPFVKNNFNDASYVGGRGELLYQIDPDWSVEFLYMHQQLKTNGTFDYDPTISTGDALNVQIFNNNFLNDTFDDATWTLKGRLGALELLYTGSYLNHRAVQQIDYSHYNTIGKFQAYYACSIVKYSYVSSKYDHCGSPNEKFNGNTINRHWTHEFRITTPASAPFRLVAGAYYDVNKVYDDAEWSYTVPQGGFGQLTAAAGNNFVSTTYPVGVAFANDVTRRDRQIAAFGEASYDIIPKALTITGGVRYYNEKASQTGTVNSIYGFRVTAPPGDYIGYCGASPCSNINLDTRLAGLSPATFSGALFKGNITYKFNPSALVYATFSQGYRPGGFNRKPCSFTGGDQGTYCTLSKSYAPDKVNNYEIGWKLGLFNHKLQFNAAAYVIEWKNIQELVFNQNLSNQAFTLNFASARIHGIEGDVTVRASPEVTITGGFSYNDSKITGYNLTNAANLISFEPVGSPLALDPKFQGNARIRWEPHLASDYKPFVQAGIHYVGSTISSDIANGNIYYSGNSYAGYGVTTTSGVYNGVPFNASTVIANLQNSYNQAAYTTFDASFGVSRDRWSFEIFGENLGNVRPALFTSGNDGETRVTTLRPRTIGAKLSFKM